LPEKAVVSDYVRKQLGAEKKLFGAVGNEAVASRLAEGGEM
jgi:ribosomal protein L9